MGAAFSDLLFHHRLLFLVIMFLALVLALEIGLRIGGHRRARIGERADEGAALVVGSILGLLAFVLALNLSNATSRFERRVESTLQEVNAIGTALLQAEAVGGDQAAGMVANLRDYMELRYLYIQAGRDSPEFARIGAETNALQRELWAQMTERIRESPTDPVSELMSSMNAAFDSSTAMQLAMEYRMPAQVIWLLLVMSQLGIAAVGYQFGLTGRRGRAPGLVLSVLWCAVVTEIVDIGSARIWSFRTDTRVYEWAMEGLDMPLPSTSQATGE
ncbi:hypothetical protein [Paracoccus xiamenensis]|uniref:hypothetical protein n=1 Tax=Paracoccus xiamenensis TaxID=2714901 RepID=UPI00140A4D8A|nr:hypothetical protein [Paracoccus xiamenensis]NHF74369.1 hypothetical protein [Paracoccus xiamenensis]